MFYVSCCIFHIYIFSCLYFGLNSLIFVYLFTICYNRSSSSHSKSKENICSVGDTLNHLGSGDPNELCEQSGLADLDMIPNNQSEAILHFTDQQAAENRVIPSEIESSRFSSIKSDADFDAFFERPILIKTIPWNVGGELDIQIDPWTDWFSNKRVSNRCNNFRNIAFKLHLKFVLNGNGFYWGDVLVSYCPLASLDDFYFTDFNDTIPASQRMHLNLDPSISKGGTMSLPFFCETDMVNIQISELNQLGRIWLRDLAPLRHPSSTTPLRIQVYAWATDVKLASPTATNGDQLSEQAGEIDEFASDGPISKPASIVEKLAGKLESVPVLKPYAMASKMAAGAVKTIAGAFGYSRPRSIEGICSYKLMQTGDMATTDAVDTSVGLGITAKREITLDPRLTGLTDQDELSIKYLSGIESFMTARDWGPEATPGITVMSFPVTPVFSVVAPREIPVVSRNAIYNAPVGWLAPNFQYWRGTMRYRFRIISSNFHKGRLGISWDPGVKTPGGIGEFNVLRTHVVDIGETKDFYVDIGWGSDYPALFVGGVEDANLMVSGATATTNVNARLHNGSLKVFVITPLVGPPDSTEPVSVQMWMSSPDMEFYDPTNRFINDYSHYPVPPFETASLTQDFPALRQTLEADLCEQSGDCHADNDTAGIMPVALPMLGAPTNKSAAAFIAGESISSLRPLLKRYTIRDAHYAFVSSLSGAIASVTVVGDNMEPIFRRDESAAPSRNMERRGNVVPTTLYRWILPAFAGYRGSRRGKLLPMGNRSSLGLSTWLQRADVSRFLATEVLGDSGDDQEELNSYIDTVDSTGNGTIVSTTNMSGAIEYEMPWYERLRFTSRHLNTDVRNIYNGILAQFFMAPDVGTVGKRVPVLHFEAAGDDWNVFYFKGVPPCFLCRFPGVTPPSEGQGRPLNKIPELAL